MTSVPLLFNGITVREGRGFLNIPRALVPKRITVREERQFHAFPNGISPVRYNSESGQTVSCLSKEH